MDGARRRAATGSARARARRRGRRGRGCWRRRRSPRRPGRRCAARRRASPSGPSATGHVMSIVCERKTEESTWRSVSSSRVAQDRVSDRRAGARAPGVSSSRLRSEPTPVRDAHHHGLADRVDRRVGDLREELLEVGEQRRLAGRRGRRARGRCPSSRSAPRPSPPSARAGPAGPPACSRTRAGGCAAARRGATRPRARAGRRAARRPARTTRRRARRVATSRLTSSSATMRPSLEVDEEQLAGLQAALAQRRCPAGSSITPVSEPSTTQPSLRLQPAAGAQAVAVERRADHAAVGEGDGGGAVPRLHQAGVEGVEALQVVGQVVAALPRLRHHHHHRVRERCGRRARAARARCRTSPSPSRRGARPAAPSAGRRRTARRRAATRARASS